MWGDGRVTVVSRWMLSAAIVLRILNGGDQRLWLLFGMVAGVGILNKHSMLFFGSGLAVGLLLTVPRQFLRPWIWLGAALSMLFFLPNFLWEMHAGWPTITASSADGRVACSRSASSTIASCR